MMQVDLVTRIDAAAGVAALASDRIAWNERRRTTPAFPAIVLTQVSTTRNWTHTGPTGLDEARVRIDFYATDALTVQALAALVQAEMELGAQVPPHSPKQVGSTIFHVGMLDAQRTFEPEDLGNNVRAFREQLDFLFHHETV